MCVNVCVCKCVFERDVKSKQAFKRFDENQESMSMMYPKIKYGIGGQRVILNPPFPCNEIFPCPALGVSVIYSSPHQIQYHFSPEGCRPW